MTVPSGTIFSNPMLANLVDAHPVLSDHRNLRPKRNIKTAMAHEVRLARLAH